MPVHTGESLAASMFPNHHLCSKHKDFDHCSTGFPSLPPILRVPCGWPCAFGSWRVCSMVLPRSVCGQSSAGDAIPGPCARETESGSQFRATPWRVRFQPTRLDHKEAGSQCPGTLGNLEFSPLALITKTCTARPDLLGTLLDCLAVSCRSLLEASQSSAGGQRSDFHEEHKLARGTNASFNSPAVFYLFGMVPMPTRHMEDLSISCECESAPRACRTKKHPYSTRTTSLHQLGTCISSMLQQCPLQHMKELSISCECGSAHEHPVVLRGRKQPAPGRLARGAPMPNWPNNAADGCPPSLILRPVRASPERACVAVVQTDAASLEVPFVNRVWYWTATTDQPVRQSPTLWNVALELRDLITTAPGACTRCAAVTPVLQVLIRCWRSRWCAHGPQRLRKAVIFGTLVVYRSLRTQAQLSPSFPQRPLSGLHVQVQRTSGSLSTGGKAPCLLNTARHEAALRTYRAQRQNYDRLWIAQLAFEKTVPLSLVVTGL